MHLLSTLLKILSYRGNRKLVENLLAAVENQELEEHAARCCGTEEEKSTAKCPICDLELQVNIGLRRSYSKYMFFPMDTS